MEPLDRSIDGMVGQLRRKIEHDSKQPRLIVTVLGEAYRFGRLAKRLVSGQGLTMAVPLSRNDEAPHENALSDARPERRAEHDLLEAEANLPPQMVIDQSKAAVSKLGALVTLWPAVAALVVLAGGKRLVYLRRHGAKTTDAALLSIVVSPSRISAAIRRRIISSTRLVMN